MPVQVLVCLKKSVVSNPSLSKCDNVLQASLKPAASRSRGTGPEQAPDKSDSRALLVCPKTIQDQGAFSVIGTIISEKAECTCLDEPAQRRHAASVAEAVPHSVSKQPQSSGDRVQRSAFTPARGTNGGACGPTRVEKAEDDTSFYTASEGKCESEVSCRSGDLSLEQRWAAASRPASRRGRRGG